MKESIKRKDKISWKVQVECRTGELFEAAEEVRKSTAQRHRVGIEIHMGHNKAVPTCRQH